MEPVAQGFLNIMSSEKSKEFYDAANSDPIAKKLDATRDDVGEDLNGGTEKQAPGEASSGTLYGRPSARTRRTDVRRTSVRRSLLLGAAGNPLIS